MARNPIPPAGVINFPRRDDTARDLRPRDVSYDPGSPIGDQVRARTVRINDIVNDAGYRLTARDVDAVTPHITINANPEGINSHWAAAFMDPANHDDHMDAHRYHIMYAGGRGSARRAANSLRGVLNGDHERYLSEEEKIEYMRSADRLGHGRDRPEDIYKIRMYDAETRARKIQSVYTEHVRIGTPPTIMRQNFSEVTPRHPREVTPLSKVLSKIRKLLDSPRAVRASMNQNPGVVIEFLEINIQEYLEEVEANDRVD